MEYLTIRIDGQQFKKSYLVYVVEVIQLTNHLPIQVITQIKLQIMNL